MTAATLPTATLPAAFSLAEPIPGYIVRERLGAGGFGEVWKADAPGGISKAIKIVNGFGDDDRANREITALNRIKQVRHPFLLSLERIEKVDGHLIIVAELATSSLKQEFDAHRAAGLAGIPRNELLNYLQDAADALDYISQVHSLQHLDIKPENLLIVGGRIKVADFGLVKDLHDNNNSLVGGMTPVYAAPELFDGRPNYCSDQYSLAIVFQEMLTGTLPFEGRTTAQLAVQHLHSQPKLDRLPLGDREVIAKALAKNSDHRYITCRAMVDALRAASAAAAQREVSVATDCANRLSNDTVAVSIEDMRAAMAAVPRNARSSSETLDPVPSVEDLDPLVVDRSEIEYGPTIFIGVGGLGVRAVQIARSRMAARFGDLRQTPALQFVALDTDADSLRQPVSDDVNLTSADDFGVLLPLKQASDYRSDKRGRFNWLSRRWIYNIPRSLQTQSFRPLGRLALVDNLERAMQCIEKAILTAVDRKSLDATAAATQLPFRNVAPRVFIVTSTSGGSGSGMALDLAYVVRTLLRKQNLAETGLCGVMAHFAGRTPQTRDMAISNTYAFLGELNHFSAGLHPYPGEPDCGLPAFAPGDRPFEHAYFVHFGEELEGESIASCADTLARYVDLCATTSANAFFGRCRPVRSKTDAAPFSLRTFGLCQLGYSHDDLPQDALKDLSKTIVRRWRSGDASSQSAAPGSLANASSMVAAQFSKGTSRQELLAEVERRLQDGGLQMEPLLTQFHETLVQAMGGNPTTYLQSVVTEILAGDAARGSFLHRSRAANVVVDSLDRIVRAEMGSNSAAVCLESALEPLLMELASEQGEKYGQWALSLTASPKHRLAGAMQSVEALCDSLRECSHRAADKRQTILRQLVDVRGDLLGQIRSGGVLRRVRRWFKKVHLISDPRLARYFSLRLDELKLNAYCRLTGFVLARVAAVGDKLRNLSADLNRLCEEFSVPAVEAVAKPDQRRTALQRVAMAQVTDRKNELVAEMEASLEANLTEIIHADMPDVRQHLRRSIIRTAQTLTLKLLNGFALGQVQGEIAGEQYDATFALSAAVAHSSPKQLAELGGKRRILLLASDALPAETLAKAAVDDGAKRPTVICDRESTVTICQEVDDIPVSRIAASVLKRRFQIIELAARLHTRTDVPWTPL